MVDLPRSPADVTPGWLNRALNQTLPWLPPVTAVDWELIGQGFGLTGVVARLRLTYVRPSNDAPSSLILKLPLAVPQTASHYRETQDRDDAARLGYYQRCAREVAFYQRIAPDLPLVVPRAYFAEASDAERSIVLLLEDLYGARSGDVLAGCSMADAHNVVERIGRVHARWWQTTSFRWLPVWGDDPADRQARFTSLVPSFLDRWEAVIPPDLRAMVERLVTKYAALLSALGRLPSTVIHADLHLDNVLFDAPARSGAVILDWQSVFRGPAIVDVGPFIAGSLVPDDRRSVEHDLLRAYHAQLAAAGVADCSIDQMRYEYRLALASMMAGVVRWLARAEPERLSGRERQLIEAALGDGRLISALRDHDVAALLDKL